MLMAVMRPLHRGALTGALLSVLCLMSSLVSPTAFGEASSENLGEAGEATGIVVVVGSAANAQTKLAVNAGSSSGTGLCRSPLAKRLGRVTGMTVAVSGVWSQNATSKEKCLEAKSFKILKTSSGRDALVGRLLKRDANYFVETSDGKQQGLNSVPPGLSKLEGKDVVIDVKPLDSPMASDGGVKSWKVVSYSEHP